jgi:hypothetical protein
MPSCTAPAFHAALYSSCYRCFIPPASCSRSAVDAAVAVATICCCQYFVDCLCAYALTVTFAITVLCMIVRNNCSVNCRDLDLAHQTLRGSHCLDLLVSVTRSIVCSQMAISCLRRAIVTNHDVHSVRQLLCYYCNAVLALCSEHAAAAMLILCSVRLAHHTSLPVLLLLLLSTVQSCTGCSSTVRCTTGS